MNENKRIHILVSGRVQGVGFRAFVQRTASELDLAGWVKNVSFNQVETEAEGPAFQLEQFLQAIQVGPRSARVEHTRVSWLDPIGTEKPFEIRFR